MNSSTSEVLWPSPVGAHENSLHVADSTQAELMVDVATAILTAIGAGLFTASVPVSTDLSVDVQYVTALLNQGNYQAAVTGPNLVINW
jgi:hypothetical protein